MVLAAHCVRQWASQRNVMHKWSETPSLPAPQRLGSGSGQMLVSPSVPGPQCNPGHAELNLGTVCLSPALATPDSGIPRDALANRESSSAGEQDRTGNSPFPLISQGAAPSQSKHVKVIFQVTGGFQRLQASSHTAGAKVCRDRKARPLFPCPMWE